MLLQTAGLQHIAGVQCEVECLKLQRLHQGKSGKLTKPLLDDAEKNACAAHRSRSDTAIHRGRQRVRGGETS